MKARKRRLDRDLDTKDGTRRITVDWDPDGPAPNFATITASAKEFGAKRFKHVESVAIEAELVDGVIDALGGCVLDLSPRVLERERLILQLVMSAKVWRTSTKYAPIAGRLGRELDLWDAITALMDHDGDDTR